MASVKKFFYYQIKGKRSQDDNDYGIGNWCFPPIFSGRVEAKDKKEAHALINEEYGKKFPLRVLKKDLESNEFLLKITPMENDGYYDGLFQDRTCDNCGKKFKRIDLYNDSNEQYKGTRFCSYGCKKETEQNEFIPDGMSPCTKPVIYKITNRQTGKCYIGQTTQSFTLRWWQHIKWGNTGCKFHKALLESKIIDWVFEVVHVCSKASELDEQEAFWIKATDSINNGYNTQKVKNINEQ